MVLFKIALRNILLHRLKTGIVGAILFFGAFIAVLGNSVVDSITGGMRTSLTKSITGDIQIYSATAKEELSVFGNKDGSMPDIGHVKNFGHIKEVLTKEIPNIAEIIPMGTEIALVSPGNLLDNKIKQLRDLFKTRALRQKSHEAKPQKNFSDESPQQPTPTDTTGDNEIANLIAHIRKIIADIKRDFSRTKDFIAVTPTEEIRDGEKNLGVVTQDSFWQTFNLETFEEKLEFLSNKIAPLIFDDNMLYFLYVGTDIANFSQAFTQFEIVKGTNVPPGKRGFLFNDYYYETLVKHRIGRRLDKINKALTSEGKTIKDHKVLQELIKNNINQAAEIYTQLNPTQATALIPKLQNVMKLSQSDIESLTEDFLNMDDTNFNNRYQFFYNNIAPHINLYRLPIGTIFPLTAMSKNGFLSAINTKVYGTFRFKSLADSPITGNLNLLDMISFRQLYGFPSNEQQQEIRAMEAEMAVKELAREDIETIFADRNIDDLVDQSDNNSDVIATTLAANKPRPQQQSIFTATYSSAEMTDGNFLHAAIILKNAKHLDETVTAINHIAQAQNLNIQAIPWQKAAGITGQLTVVIRLILYSFVAIIFLVATFIMMNSLIMATMERRREIGTMRAIGAQKSFVTKLFLIETCLINLLFGGAGIFAATLIIVYLRKIGIPGQGDVALFFFSGPRLYLILNYGHLLIVFLIITAIAIIATQYPAWLAMKISPLAAMENEAQ